MSALVTAVLGIAIGLPIGVIAYGIVFPPDHDCRACDAGELVVPHDYVTHPIVAEILAEPSRVCDRQRKVDAFVRRTSGGRGQPVPVPAEGVRR